MALLDLFHRAVIPCFDGDQSCATNSSPHGPRIRGCITAGIPTYGIEIIAHAAPHYLDRYGSATRRLLAAIMELSDVLSLDPTRSRFRIGIPLGEEWRKNISEVLGVGLATQTVCHFLPAHRSEIRRIRKASGRRTCDFLIIQPNQITVYEARGRKDINSAQSAAKDLPEKKATHKRAHYRYGLIALTGIPGPLEVGIYDPPGELDLPLPAKHEYLLPMARYYSSFARAAGLLNLAYEMESRVYEIEKAEKWIEKPLPISEKQITYDAKSWKSGSETFFHSQFQPRIYYEDSEYKEIEGGSEREGQPHKEHNVLRYGLDFGVSSRIIELLAKWELEKLHSLDFKPLVNTDMFLYMGSDGIAVQIVKTGK